MSKKPKSQVIKGEDRPQVDLIGAFMSAIKNHPANAKDMIDALRTQDVAKQIRFIKQFQLNFATIPDALNQLFKESPTTKRAFYLMELAYKISEFGQRNGNECSHDYIAMRDVHHSLTDSFNAYEQLTLKTEKQFERFRVEWISAIKVLRPILDRNQKHSSHEFFKPSNNSLLTTPTNRLFDDELRRTDVPHP